MEKAGRKQREDFAMTETKYIFPKQMQSVAALVFIAVLILLQQFLTFGRILVTKGDERLHEHTKTKKPSRARSIGRN